MRIFPGKSRGFTLIEVALTMGIIGIIIAMSMVTDFGVIQKDSFQTENSKLLDVLSRARSRAMANLFDSSYGVCYLAPNYVIFRETDGECLNGIPSNELILADELIAGTSNFSSDFPTIIFDRLSGISSGNTILLTDGIRSTQIQINEEGTINW